MTHSTTLNVCCTGHFLIFWLRLMVQDHYAPLCSRTTWSWTWTMMIWKNILPDFQWSKIKWSWRISDRNLSFNHSVFTSFEVRCVSLNWYLCLPLYFHAPWHSVHSQTFIALWSMAGALNSNYFLQSFSLSLIVVLFIWNKGWFSMVFVSSTQAYLF